MILTMNSLYIAPFMSFQCYIYIFPIIIVHLKIVPQEQKKNSKGKSTVFRNWHRHRAYPFVFYWKNLFKESNNVSKLKALKLLKSANHSIQSPYPKKQFYTDPYSRRRWVLATHFEKIANFEKKSKCVNFGTNSMQFEKKNQSTLRVYLNITSDVDL